MNKCILEPIPVDDAELYVKKEIEKFKPKVAKKLTKGAGSLSGIAKKVAKKAKKVAKKAKKRGLMRRFGSSVKKLPKSTRVKYSQLQ